MESTQNVVGGGGKKRRKRPVVRPFSDFFLKWNPQGGVIVAVQSKLIHLRWRFVQLKKKRVFFVLISMCLSACILDAINEVVFPPFCSYIT